MENEAAKKLFLEQAAAYYDELKLTAENAPYGRILANAEAFAVVQGRELLRQSLEGIVQDQSQHIDNDEKKNGKTCPCGGTRRHCGKPTRQNVTSLGTIHVKRIYWECRKCLTAVHPADEALGIAERYSVGARRLAVMAGASWSFDKASEHLEEFCGLKISDNTIRNLCQKEAVPMGRWQRNDPVANAEYIAAQGEVEFTTDGTCVNTVDGWREMRVAIFAKRNPGECVHADQWDERKLPKPHVSVAMAAIENKETFRRHWGVRARQLQVENETISILADGAHWIWDAAMLEFDKRDEVLDVYHALEKISDCGKVLYGTETKEFATWQDETTLELLWNGFELIEKRLDKRDAELQLDLEQPAESRSKSQTKLDAEKEAIRVLRGYLSNHATRLNYRQRLANGKSIGSGQIEGACKNLIGRRLKQTGARWRVHRVNKMGTLCSLLYSQQWKAYWITAK